MNFKITTLVENSVYMGKGLIGEHGISFLIETNNKRKILFDTGQGKALFNNAKLLGLDLNKIDTVVLSHGHYDHTGGIKGLIEYNKSFKFVAHPDIFAHKLAIKNNKERYIGTPFNKDFLKKAKINLQISREPVEIGDGIITTGEVPMKTGFEAVESVFYIKEKNQNVPDPLADDSSLILDTEKGLVVLFGCCHRGLINTLNHIFDLTGNKKIYAIMGGLHLGQASDIKLKKIIGYLREFDIKKIGVSHCTGMPATLAFFNGLPGRVFLNTTGCVEIF